MKYEVGSSYKPRQAREHFIPHIKFIPEWFIDCGPGCASEYKDARHKWPSVALLGLEPSPIGYEAARQGFPVDDNSLLLQVAIWDKDEIITLHQASDLLHSLCFRRADEAQTDDPTGDSADMVKVQARSLDSLDAEYGPFDKVVLWMDIEGSERRALRGAKNLLSRGAIWAVNIETRPEYEIEFNTILSQSGLKTVSRYLQCETYWDEVWIRRGE